MTRHGRHWPREEQQANAFEGFGFAALTDDGVGAARVRLAWAPLLPPFEIAADQMRPEFNNVGREDYV